MTDNESLKEKIEERKSLVSDIFWFVRRIVKKLGKRELESEVLSPTIYVENSLENFYGFSFLIGYSYHHSRHDAEHIFEEFTVQIWFRPLDERLLVFSVTYSGSKLDDCKVQEFNEDGSWLSALRDLMSRENKIITQVKQSEKDQEKERLEQAKKAVERTRLIKEATALKMEI